MKRNWRKAGTIAVVAVVLAGAGLLATQKRARAEAAAMGMMGQEGCGGHMMGHEGHRMDAERMTGMLTDFLDLSDAQQTQVKALLTSAQPQMDALHQQMKSLHQMAMQAAMATPFDEAKLRASFSAQAPAMIDSAVAMAKVHAQIYALLTPEQQAKMQKHMTRMEQEHEHEHQMPAAPAAGGTNPGRQREPRGRGGYSRPAAGFFLGECAGERAGESAGERAAERQGKLRRAIRARRQQPAGVCNPEQTAEEFLHILARVGFSARVIFQRGPQGSFSVRNLPGRRNFGRGLGLVIN